MRPLTNKKSRFRFSTKKHRAQQKTCIWMNSTPMNTSALFDSFTTGTLGEVVGGFLLHSQKGEFLIVDVEDVIHVLVSAMLRIFGAVALTRHTTKLTKLSIRHGSRNRFFFIRVRRAKILEEHVARLQLPAPFTTLTTSLSI